jgi:hypothetical protein
MTLRLGFLTTFVVALVAVAASLAVTLAADGPNRAGLVVTFENHTETYWIEFEEEQISGVDLLERSGLDVTYSGFGGLGSAVCAIDGVGCTNPGDCWCQCKSGTCNRWVYFRMEDGEWKQMPFGASTRVLKDGDVDGWTWGAGDEPADQLTPYPCPTATTPATDAPTQVAPTSQATLPPAAPDEIAPETFSMTPPPVLGASRTAVGTPRPTAIVRHLDDIAGGDEADAASESDGGGTPVGLIAFGGVAAAMAAAGGAVIARRRFRG